MSVRREPAASAIRLANECRVVNVVRSALSGRRLRISSTALLVKEIAQMRPGSTPDAIRYRILEAITRVFPDPAGAATRAGPSRCATASACRALKESSVSGADCVAPEFARSAALVAVA